MSSFRNHRVVIASLFLPATAVLNDSTPPTPHRAQTPGALVIPPSAFKPTPRPGHTRTASVPVNIPGLAGPPKSIVEDLKDKVYFI